MLFDERGPNALGYLSLFIASKKNMFSLMVSTGNLDSVPDLKLQLQDMFRQFDRSGKGFVRLQDFVVTIIEKLRTVITSKSLHVRLSCVFDQRIHIFV